MPETAPSATPTSPASNPAEQVLAQLSELSSQVKKQQTQLGLLNQNAKNPTVPFVRSGEDINSSRGFQYSRVIGLMMGVIDKNLCKQELLINERLQKEYVERGLYVKTNPGNIVVPFASDFIAQSTPGMGEFATEIGQMVRAGSWGGDAGEIRRMAGRFNMTKALGWMEPGGLDSFTPFPAMGEPIELLRNQAVWLKAGARSIPLPPANRMAWPRLTGATTAYWIGSGTTSRSITASEPTSGDMVLQGRKLGVRVTLPNELFRFPSISVEQLVRADMMLSAALKMDAAFIYGTGSATEPKGVINYDNVQTHTASTTGADGDTIEPEDITTMIGKVEEQNLTFGSWIGRPLLYAHLANKRADAVTAGDKKGPFLFNILRGHAEGYGQPLNNAVGNLESYPFHKTNQIPKNREKGVATDLSFLLGGDFSQSVVGISGVMEFAVATQGDTIFPQDQTDIRMITWCDMALRHPEAFILCDDLTY